MSTFDKIVAVIKPTPPNGHADINKANIKSLRKAKREIKEMIKKGSK